MIDRRRAALAVAAALAIGGAGARSTASAAPRAPHATGERSAQHVVIVGLPTLTWAELRATQPPAIMEVLARSSIASMSVRTIGPTTTLAEGYATIGAGNRAPAPPLAAGLALRPDELLDGAPASDVFTRRTGVAATGSVLHIGMPQLEKAASRQHYGAEPGALGQALVEAGMDAAVVAETDLGRPAFAPANRPAALAVVDRAGQVAGGTVGPPLALDDASAPFGLRSDTAAILAQAEEALQEHEVLVVEASDLERVDQQRPLASSRATSRATAAAVDAADRLVAGIDDRLDPTRDVLILVAPDAPAGTAHLTVFAISGPGFEPGLARSATTRRDGFVTLPDVGPTVLEALGIDVPDAMNGTAITTGDGGALDASTIDDLVDTDEITRFRDRSVGPVSVTYIVLQVLVYALTLFALRRGWPWARRLATGGALLVLAMPTVTFASGLVRYDQLPLVGYVVALVAAAGALGAFVWALARGRALLAPLVLVGLTLLVQLADIALGGHLQLNTPFGYSPAVAGRFAGFGNLAFGLTAMAALVLVTGAWSVADPDGDSRPIASRTAPRWLIGSGAVVFAAVIVLDGLPSLGSDVGGVLAAVPPYAMALALMAGIAVTWRRFVLLLVAAAAVVGGFAAIDLARPAADRTHLGRFADRLLHGEAGDTLARKAEANVSILTSSVWTWFIPFALAFLAFLTWRRTGALRTLQQQVPGLRTCMVAAVALCSLGMAVNDSGVAVPAMMFGMLLPWVSWLVLEHLPRLVPAGGTPPSPPGAAGR